MTEQDIQQTALYHTCKDTVKHLLMNNVDVLTEQIMPIFHGFIEDRITNYELYRNRCNTCTQKTIVIKEPEGK